MPIQSQQQLSLSAELSQIYTNHSVSATAITLWSNAGLSNRHIMAISGHRNEQSLQSYNSRPSSSQLHHCSNVLSQALNPMPLAQHNQQQRLPNIVGRSYVEQNVLTRQENIGFESIFSGCSIGSVNISINDQVVQRKDRA